MSLPRVLVIGGGSIGERHLRCFLRTGQARVSMCEPREERMAFLQETYDIDEAHRDFDAVDLSAFDAVVVCTPPNLHVGMCRHAVEAGCHVLCEKPLSNTLDGLDELIALAGEKGVAAGVAFVFRHMPGFAKIRDLLREGLVGDVKLVTFKSGQQFSKFRPDYKRIYFASKEMGGGAINDACSHSLNFLQWCFGMPTELASFHDHLSDMEIETEDAALMLMRFGAGGPMVQLQQNLFQKDYAILQEYVGSEGTLRLGGRLTQAGAQPELQVFHNDDEGWQTIPMPEAERDDFFTWQAEHFLAAMRGDKAPMSTLEEGKQIVQLCEAARESYETKRIVQLGG